MTTFSACPTFNSEEVELSRLGTSLADLTDLIPCTSEVLDADALLEGLEFESDVHFEEPKRSDTAVDFFRYRDVLA